MENILELQHISKTFPKSNLFWMMCLFHCIMYEEDVFITKIISRNFRVLCDFMDVYQFMIEIYEKDWRNGVPAPFLEYALSSD